MKKFLLGTTAVAFAALTAVPPVDAADLPMKAPPPAAADSWAGCYIGGNAGAAFGRSKLTHTPTGSWSHVLDPNEATSLARDGSSTIHTTGFTGGAQIGCNWQTSPNWVWGGELDGEYLGLKKRTSYSALFLPDANRTYTQETKIDWLTTLRGRVGFTPDGRWLVYATGGVAFGHASISQSVFFSTSLSTAAGSASATRVGWTAGGGIEYMLTRNWIARGEYLYVDLGATSANLFNPGFPLFTHNIESKTTIHIARAALSYKF